MQITKAIFDKIAPGEIFKVVTTKLQTIQEPFKATLKFVCVKNRSGYDWVIYVGTPAAHEADIARYGDMVHDRETILSMCPCDEEVFALYRQ